VLLNKTSLGSWGGMRQLQVRTLSGRTALVEGVPAGDVSALRARISELEGIPADQLRLRSAGHELHENGNCTFDGAMVTVLLRLLGGKGGFGAMLRTAGARGVKTTNFDACRDLNGRRLRHVNAEAKLREWDMQAEERKLKKQQDAAKNARPGPEPVARFDDDEYEEMLEGARTRVTDALAAAASASADGAGSSADQGVPTGSLRTTAAAMSATASGKRKATAPVLGSADAKTAKLHFDPLAGLGADSDSSSSDGSGDE
jgi:hypothetical protein